MQLTIAGGAKYDVASPGEVRQIMRDESAREREKTRGIKPFRKAVMLPGTAGTHGTINDGICPDAGYLWVLRLLSVSLATAGTGQAFITSDSSAVLGGIAQALCIAAFTTSAAYQVQTLGNGACILGEGEGLYLNFTQDVTGYLLAGWQIPAERIGNLA